MKILQMNINSRGGTPEDPPPPAKSLGFSTGGGDKGAVFAGPPEGPRVY